MSLPMRLDAVVHLVKDTGAVIRHQTDDYNAVIIDLLPGGLDGLFLAVRQVWDGEGELKKKHYKKFLIDDHNLKDWMLLSPGSDYALGDGE